VHRIAAILFPCLILILAACAPKRQAVAIPFVVTFAGQPIGCDPRVGDLALTDLRFFVHDVRLGSDAEVSPLADDGLWQTAEIALIDLETAVGSCVNGTPGVNANVMVLAVAERSPGLRFTIGVPASLNHENPLTASSPLSRTDMHWHWSTGYKFLRAGAESEQGGFWLHLGSNRCDGTIGNSNACRSPNRPTVDIPDFVAGEHAIEIDLARVFDGAKLGEGVVGNCSSGPTEASCTPIFKNFGLDPDAGTTIGNAVGFSAVAIER